MSPQFVHFFSAQGSIAHDALRFGAIYDFPRFADPFLRWQFFAELGFEVPPAPDAFHKDRFEGEGTGDRELRIVDCGFQIGKFVGRFRGTPFILEALQNECDPFSVIGCQQLLGCF
jgi:hypothetical protein